MWDRTAYVYSPGDALGVGRQPSRDFVPSPWTVMEAAKGSAVAITAAIALGVIFLLGRRK